MAFIQNGKIFESARHLGEGRRVLKALRLLGMKADKIETRGVWRAGDLYLYEPVPVIDLGTRSGNGKFAKVRAPSGEEVIGSPFEPEHSTGSCLWIEATIPTEP